MKYGYTVKRDGILYPAGTEVPDIDPIKVELTDDVPDGAPKSNPDGSTNVYDAGGNMSGTISKEEIARQQELIGESLKEQNVDVVEPEKPKRGRKPEEQ